MFKIPVLKKYKYLKHLPFKLNKDKRLEDNKDKDESKVELEKFECNPAGDFFNIIITY